MAKKLIGLDAGHGLKTAGKQTPNGIKEWTLNDKVRDKVVALLKDYDVEIIHMDNDEGNVDESLTARHTAYINKKVDAFVSIHHNAYTGKWNNATGVEVYTDKNYTAADMALAKAIYKNLPAYTGLKGRGIKKENWAVINQNKIPAVLVEGGFMDSNIDHKVITSEAGQNGYARAVAEGLIEFLQLKKKVVAQPKPTIEAYSGYITIIYNGLAYHNAPSWADNTISGTVKKNEIYTVVGRIKVDGVYMYKLKSGAYITSASQYVKYSSTYPKATTTTTKPAAKPAAAAKVLKVGAKVKINLTAGKYATGQKIPLWVKAKAYTVKEIKGDRVLLSGIMSWVYTKDVKVQ